MVLYQIYILWDKADDAVNKQYVIKCYTNYTYHLAVKPFIKSTQCKEYANMAVLTCTTHIYLYAPLYSLISRSKFHYNRKSAQRGEKSENKMLPYDVQQII